MTRNFSICHIPKEVLDTVTQKSRVCIDNLIDYLATLEPADLSSQPQSKLGAVLVLLYEQDDELRVLLTTRSKHLRTHAGQTALPGGKQDPSDKDLTMTAYREAQEEVALPLDSPAIYTLGRLEPFISIHRVFVTPIIAFLAQPVILRSLKASEAEVSLIFSHPLEAILDPTLVNRETLVAIGSDDWPYQSDVHNTNDSVVHNSTYRMHRFRTSASPIKGLTADILIKTAEIAYATSTTYDRYAPEQLQSFADISRALVDEESLSEP